MLVRTDDLIAEATSLPVEDRALIADCILKSLNPPQSDIDQKWAAAAERRLAELRSGQVQSVPGNEVFARIWKRFGV
jgi:putative addiction module component (TIGR02574 family)